MDKNHILNIKLLNDIKVPSLTLV